MTSVLGAPGSGKSTAVALLGTLLPGHVVLDWDALIRPASDLAGRDVARSPSTWAAYRRLVRAVVDAVMPAPLVLLGVSTPDELDGWPVDEWILLDCSETERRRRLGPRLDPARWKKRSQTLGAIGLWVSTPSTRPVAGPTTSLVFW
jgi:hypothetical protein